MDLSPESSVGFRRSSSYNRVLSHDPQEDVMLEIATAHDNSESSMTASLSYNTNTRQEDDGLFTIDSDDEEDQRETSLALSVSDVSNSHSNDQPPQTFRCPLTLQLMEDPVNDACGHCFERRAIQDWLDLRDFCPISRKPIMNDDLVVNGHLKARIQQWKEDHPLYQHGSRFYRKEQVDEMLSVSDHDSHSRFELMLLPQERVVLKIVKSRAESRRKAQEYRRRMIILGVLVTVVVVTVLVLALVYGDLKSVGPV
mmetsp:Transcript_5170/g.9680  ORF Transcript_5170/g.9680 Transcript_5170/m.9680 type:complete len:255 (-) Transcript_5170:3616-4380(-)